jgi:hypothetical protein
MFARYFIELPVTREEVERTLSNDPRGWLPGLATDANHRGDQLLAEVGFGERVRVKREVVLELGPYVRSSSKTAFPLRWRASEHPGLFPALDADLEVAPLGGGRTQLAMSARYVPPFGAFGKAIDRALLSRVAEATLKDFLDAVGTSILASLEASAADEAREAIASGGTIRSWPEPSALPCA